jgi:hypothetical protein
VGLAHSQPLGVAYVRGVGAISHGTDHSYTRAALEDPKCLSPGSAPNVVAPILDTSVPGHLRDRSTSSVARRLAPFKVAPIWTCSAPSGLAPILGSDVVIVSKQVHFWN